MENLEFFTRLTRMNWQVIPNNEPVMWDNLAEGRLTQAPEELKEFISSYRLCADPEDKVWFLSPSDYADGSGAAFPWNEYENQSKEFADGEERESITRFWQVHLPFLFSVKNGYAYLAYTVAGENTGQIVAGSELMYEKTVIVADSLKQFKGDFLGLVEGKNKSETLGLVL